MAKTDMPGLDLGVLDSLSRQDTPIHSIDPRAKLVTTLLYLIMVVSFDRYAVSALIGFVVYPAALCAVGGIPLGLLGRKILMVAPLAVLLGAFNPLLDREPVVTIGAVAVAGGWVSLLSILVRFTLTVAATLTLIAVTGFNPICAALGRLGVPRVFVAQLMFLYRYLFVLVEEAARAARARTLRAAGQRRRSLSSYGSLLGGLFLRTFGRAQRIHLAMRCRGYRGVLPTARPLRLGVRDVGFMLGWGALFVALRTYNVPLWMGATVRGLLS